MTGGERLDGVREGYDRWSEIYDEEDNPLIALEEGPMHEAFGDVAGLRVLDLGCGTGRHTAWLAAAGAQVTALDFSPGMLERARGKTAGASVRFVPHDLHQPLPFEAGSFDLAVSALVLEHLRAPEHFFGEVHRVLRPGSRAVMSAMHPAMFLRGVQARFTAPGTGEVVQPGSLPHQVGDFVMAAIGSGFGIEGVIERALSAEIIRRLPDTAKYEGWPMLLMLVMRARD